MQGLTYAALCALTDSEQIREERLAIICEGEKCGEDEAKQIATGAQLEMWDTPK